MLVIKSDGDEVRFHLVERGFNRYTVSTRSKIGGCDFFQLNRNVALSLDKFNHRCFIMGFHWIVSDDVRVDEKFEYHLTFPNILFV
jgi:hypothetical protein